MDISFVWTNHYGEGNYIFQSMLEYLVDGDTDGEIRAEDGDYVEFYLDMFVSEPGISIEDVTGRDIVRGIPKQVLLEASDVRNALQPVVNDIIEAIRISLSQTPPALVSDIDKDGAWLTGGGSLLKQMDKKIAEELGIPINNTDDPLSSVVIGSGICLERFQDYKSVLKLSPKPN